MGPRDPIERGLLIQRGDPVVSNEDPGWINRTGTRETPYYKPKAAMPVMPQGCFHQELLENDPSMR